MKHELDIFVSKKCGFMDLDTDIDGDNQVIEVILKIIDDVLSLETLAQIRRTFQVGDIVQIHGVFETIHTNSHLLLHAHDVTVIEKWNVKNPSMFVHV